jgi:hypothetical protein
MVNAEAIENCLGASRGTMPTNCSNEGDEFGKSHTHAATHAPRRSMSYNVNTTSGHCRTSGPVHTRGVCTHPHASWPLLVFVSSISSSRPPLNRDSTPARNSSMELADGTRISSIQSWRIDLIDKRLNRSNSCVGEGAAETFGCVVRLTSMIMVG